MGSLPPFGT
jgi:hypothetical protein